MKFIGIPDASNPKSPTNDPNYIDGAVECAAKSNILQALKDYRHVPGQPHAGRDQDPEQGLSGVARVHDRARLGHPRAEARLQGPALLVRHVGRWERGRAAELHAAARRGHHARAATCRSALPKRPRRFPRQLLQLRAVDGGQQEGDRAGILVLALVRRGAPASATRNGAAATSSKKKDLIILADVQRRTLQDTVTLNGTLARQELRKVTRRHAGSRRARSTRRTARAARAGDAAVRDRRPRRDRGAGHRAVLPAAQRRRPRRRRAPAQADPRGRRRQPRRRWTRCSRSRRDSRSRSGRRSTTIRARRRSRRRSVTVSLAQGTGYTLGKQTAAGLIIGPARHAARPPRQPGVTRHVDAHGVPLAR